MTSTFQLKKDVKLMTMQQSLKYIKSTGSDSHEKTEVFCSFVFILCHIDAMKQKWDIFRDSKPILCSMVRYVKKQNLDLQQDHYTYCENSKYLSIFNCFFFSELQKERL